MSLTVFLGLVVVCVSVGLFTLNLYHAHNACHHENTNEELQKYIESLNKRLLQAESQSLRNTLMVNKLLHLVQVKLYQIETGELEEISKKSQDEAIRLALALAKYPAPPMPEFPIDGKYKDADALADLVDDIFGEMDDKSKESYNYYSADKSGDKSKGTEPSLTDTEARKTCSEWKEKYTVVTGVSWGNLPYDLQQKWILYACDYHLNSGGEEEESKPGKEKVSKDLSRGDDDTTRTTTSPSTDEDDLTI